MKLRAIAAALLSATVLHAQDSAHVGWTRWTFAGGETENYARYLQTLGVVPRYPWSNRSFSRAELAVLSPQAPHSWIPNARIVGRQTWSIAPLELRGWHNSAFPHGRNDGPIWVGRGQTWAVRGGAALSSGPFEIVLAPIAFWAENRPFDLASHGRPDSASVYNDPLFPVNVDRPQRFGDAAYARLDPGQSSLTLSLGPVVTGVSTANMWWGPMSEFPYVLGNNAPGFPHVFMGSSRPVHVWIGRLHGRVLYGELSESSFSPAIPSERRRFASGMVASFEPDLLPGLEVGGARFFHARWPENGLTVGHFTHLFESFLKLRVSRVFDPDPIHTYTSTDNQLASAFARWVFPSSGLELYGEYGKEDHNVDAQDAIKEPDHAAIVGWGVRKAWAGGRRPMHGLRAEVVNFQESTLRRHRAQGGTYHHGNVRQGHTQRGQLLGSAFAVGSGSGAVFAWERFAAATQTRVSVARLLVQDRNVGGRGTSVQYGARLERRHRGCRSPVETTAAVDGVYELNRNAVRDVFNARLELGVAWMPWQSSAIDCR